MIPLDSIEEREKEITKKEWKLSPSSINTYFSCPRKFHYNYIMKLPTKKNISLVRGDIVHKILENFFDKYHDLNNKPDYKAYLFSLMDAMLKEYWKVDLDELRLTIDQETQYYQETKLMLYNFIFRFINQIEILLINKKANDKNHAFNLIKPKLREHHIEDTELKLQGYIDSIEIDFDENVILVDYKTSNKYKNIIPEDYKRQLAIYALLYYKKQGKPPTYVAINYLMYGEIFYMNVTPSMITYAEQEVKYVHDSIVDRDKKYYPKKESKLCNYCDFFEFCRKDI